MSQYLILRATGKSLPIAFIFGAFRFFIPNDVFVYRMNGLLAYWRMGMELLKFLTVNHGACISNKAMETLPCYHRLDAPSIRNKQILVYGVSHYSFITKKVILLM